MANYVSNTEAETLIRLIMAEINKAKQSAADAYDHADDLLGQIENILKTI